MHHTIQNSQEVITKIQSIDYDVDTLKSVDFTNLYTNIELKLAKNKIEPIIKKLFKNQKFLTFYSNSAEGSDCKHDKLVSLSCDEFIKCFRYSLDGQYSHMCRAPKTKMFMSNIKTCRVEVNTKSSQKHEEFGIETKENPAGESREDPEFPPDGQLFSP